MVIKILIYVVFQGRTIRHDIVSVQEHCRLDIMYHKGVLRAHVYMSNVVRSMSQWFSCPFAIWGLAMDDIVVKHSA